MQPVLCSIQRDVAVYVAVHQGRQLTTALGFDLANRSCIEIVILELSRNLLAHAGGGTLVLEPLQRNGRQGIAVATRDTGPGIADIRLALRDGWSTTRTLGAGLPCVQRLMDGLVIESTVNVGTYVRAFKWNVPHNTGSYRKGIA